VERITDDGVEVVINHLEPYKIKGQPIFLYLEKEFSIDTEDDSIAALGLTDIYAFNVDSSRNMYLFNNPMTKENLVYKFDSYGTLQKSFLRRGQGPGEVQSPTLPIIAENDDFVIFDYFPKKLLFLSSDGEIVNELSFDARIWNVFPLRNGNYFVEESRRSSTGAYTDNLMLLYDHDMNEIQQLMNYRDVDLRNAAKIKGTMIERRFILWAISNGKIYVGNNDKTEYEIFVYDYEGNLLRKIRKEYTPVEVSEEYKRKIRDPYEKNPNEIVRDIAKRIYFPEYMPPYQSFFCDDEGRLFVITFEKNDITGEYFCDVYDPDGCFISRVGVGNFANWDSAVQSQLVVIVKQKRLYCIQEKDSGYKELVVYRMNWE
jgi:hypothetical protein